MSNHFTLAERKAIANAANARIEAIGAAERESIRSLVAGTATLPPITPCPAGKLLCSCGLSQCSVCLGRKAKAA